MNLFKINSKRVLTIALIIFLAFGLVRNVSAAQIKIVPGGLLVDGEPFIIKGVNYSPTPIGVDPENTSPYGDYFTSDYSPIYERDLSFLRDMGANTIQVWDYNHGADHTDFLNKVYNDGVRPIYVVLTFVFNPAVYSDITSQEARQKIKADFRSMVAQYKNHPAILMWSIGNELNVPNMYGDRLRDLFTLINEMAHQAHIEEGINYHPVTTPLADIDLINTIEAYDLLAPNLDIWGVNIYRGNSFGNLFTEFKQVGTKPLLIMGFGIDAYDENTGDEYENVGIPYQATYAESLWKEISANLDVCLGGLIKSYSDEWWLGKTGNTLGGCPDNDPAFHSPCGHPSDSDPDGFVNYEWFGIMRAVSPTLTKVGEGGFPLDILEPRKAYSTLKSLWTVLEIIPQPVIIRSIPQVLPSVKPLDLTRVPTTEELMAAGQLGGQLYPTRQIGTSDRDKKINFSFGEAIQQWNNHEYKKAVQAFKNHLQDYPDSPWGSEAILHVGCDAQYNGRYTEAEESFKWILEKLKGQTEGGAKRLMNKARLRLGVLKVYQNNFKEAKDYFTVLLKEGSDWRDRTYASHWIQRLSRYTASQLSMLNCGTQAIACLLEKDGRMEEARRVMEMLPQNEPGHSLKALSEIALQYGYHFSAIRVSDSELKQLPLPAIMHIQGKNEGDSGHYWVLKSVNGDTVELFDPQAGLRFEQTHEEFLKEWSGIALVFSDRENLPGIRVAEGEMDQLYGGCCGVPRPESQLGGSGRNQGQSSGNGNPCGSPAWSVNMVNMNLYVNDVPLWYSSQRGPSVNISISYNSQSAINQNEPFGNKWMFTYSSYLTVDTAGNVTIFMPDGRRDVYVKSGSTYTPPYQVFNTLTKIAENHYELKFPNNVVFVYNIPQGTSSQQPFLVAIRDTHNQSLTFGYNSNVKLTTITDALGRITTLTYNGQGLVTLVTDPFNRTASFEYDANRNLTRITDMAGHSSTLSYNANVYLTSIQNERGNWQFYIEPADGIPSETYPAPGASMWQNYRITVTNPLGDKEEYYYGGDSGIYTYYVSPQNYIAYASSSVNNYFNAPKVYYYLTQISGNGEISKIVDPEWGSVTIGYDTAGNRTSIQDANGKTTTLTYDTNGNVLSITDPLGNSAQFTYDANNHLTQLTDPASRNYIYEYTGHDLTRITDPRSGVVNLTYNSYGQLLTLQNPRANSTTFAYDASGNLITVTNPLSGQDSYTYDTIGRVAVHTDPKNNTKSLARDGLGRITQVTYQDQSTKTFAYDCCRLTTVTDPNGTLTFNYDTLKRLSSLTDVYGKTISLGYDKNNNVTTLTYPDSKVVTYEYDSADRLVKVTDWLNNITTYSYDLTNNLVKATYPNGFATTYHYDNANRLDGISDIKPDGTVNAAFKYVLDQLENRTAISSTQPLNAIPSLPNTSYTHDADNRLLTSGSATFGYDNNGNLITKTSGGVITNYSWDFNDMLTQVSSGTNTYTYRYDVLGNRIARIENGVEKRYVGGLAETDISGNITAYYVHGLGLISKITPSNQPYYYHFDGIGSTIGMTDSLGNVVNKYAYDAFGAVLNQEEAISNSLKYVGQYGVMDEGNGLLYMRARYYDPEAGRFISKDPIGFAGGDLNLYAYVANNPINFVDPLGLIRYNAPPPRTVPVEGATLGALQCLERCLQTATNNPSLDLLVTGGAEETGHIANSRHYEGESCDVAGPRFNPINDTNVNRCARRCGFATSNFETFPNNPNRNHWHLELPIEYP